MSSRSYLTKPLLVIATLVAVGYFVSVGSVVFFHTGNDSFAIYSQRMQGYILKTWLSFSVFTGVAAALYLKKLRGTPSFLQRWWVSLKAALVVYSGTGFCFLYREFDPDLQFQMPDASLWRWLGESFFLGLFYCAPGLLILTFLVSLPIDRGK